MEKIIFDDKNINKSNFYKNKKLFNIYDIEFDKVLISKKEAYGKKSSFKYILGYNDDDVIKPLCIKLPQMIGYIKHFDSNKTMLFKVNDNRLLKQYTKIWERVSAPVYGDNDKYIKAEIKSYGDKVNTNFQGKKIPKENASYKCLSLIMLDSFIRLSKKYYPQTFLEECKYEIKKTKMENLISDDLDESSSDNETDYELDNETEFDNDE